MPEPVFVPRGEQLATALTRACSGAGAGPGGRLAQLHPRKAQLGLSVPVAEEGVADVALRATPGADPDGSPS